MGWLRFAGTVLTATALGCTGESPAWTGRSFPQPRSSVPVAVGQQRLQAEDHKAPSHKDGAVEPASFVIPGLRSTAKEEFGLPEPEGRITASVMARVNGQPILVEEVLSAAAPRLLEMQSTEPESRWPARRQQILQEVLQELVDRELILQEVTARIPPQTLQKVREAADKEFNTVMRKRKEQLQAKLGKKMTDEEFQAYLEKQGVSFGEMRRQNERTFIATEYMRSRIRGKVEQELGREQLLEYYRQNLSEFERPERVVWQHIFIDLDRFPDREAARRHAEDVLAQVQAVQTDSDFAALAAKYSHHPGEPYRKGEGEGTQRGLIRPPDVEELVFRLKPGQTGPLVEVLRGFHIVRVVDHQPAGRVPFEQAIPDIRKKLQSQLAQAEYARILKDLRSKAHIETALSQ